MHSAKYLKIRSWRLTCEPVHSTRRSRCCVDASTVARRREIFTGSSARRLAKLDELECANGGYQVLHRFQFQPSTAALGHRHHDGKEGREGSSAAHPPWLG